jgi:hypothetical protein
MHTSFTWICMCSVFVIFSEVSKHGFDFQKKIIARWSFGSILYNIWIHALSWLNSSVVQDTHMLWVLFLPCIRFAIPHLDKMKVRADSDCPTLFFWGRLPHTFSSSERSTKFVCFDYESTMLCHHSQRQRSQCSMI